MLAVRRGSATDFHSIMNDLRSSVTRGLSQSNITSLSNAHSQLLKLHVLHEIEALSGLGPSPLDSQAISQNLTGRLDIIGSFTDDKQYILGLRRAVIALSK